MDYWNKACDAADFVIKNKIQPVKLVRGKTPNVYRYFIDKYWLRNGDEIVCTCKEIEM